MKQYRGDRLKLLQKISKRALGRQPGLLVTAPAQLQAESTFHHHSLYATSSQEAFLLLDLFDYSGIPTLGFYPSELLQY